MISECVLISAMTARSSAVGVIVARGAGATSTAVVVGVMQSASARNAAADNQCRAERASSDMSGLRSMRGTRVREADMAIVKHAPSENNSVYGSF
jgi:hypothetical protein